MGEYNIEVGSSVVSFEEGVLTFSNGYSIKLKTKKPKGKTVSVFAFTGMALGELEIVKENETTVEVVKSDGKKLIFDKVSGLQINCKHPRYANRIK